MSHTCHWPNCPEEVPPRMWGCKRHWFTLPDEIRKAIWAAYVPGQEITKRPSRAYLEAALRARDWIREHERAAQAQAASSARALTIHQPHAWAIMAGIKPYENRGWASSYRGRLWIHSSISRQQGLHYPGMPAEPKLGAILGCVEMVDCLPIPQVDHPYATGPWCHHYINPRMLDRPIKCKGKQGYWHISREDLADAEGQLAGDAGDLDRPFRLESEVTS